MAEDQIRLRVESELANVSPCLWNACAGASSDTTSETPVKPLTVQSSPSRKAPPNPFVSHEFLSALEASGCVTPTTGWLPQHLLLECSDGTLIGACPAYLKSHSRGEYVFDEGWADAYERAGGEYYPKLQVSIPFTPVTGPKLLLQPDADSAAGRAALVQGLTTLAEMRKASSVHATFLTLEDAAAYDDQGYLPRTDQQFHWRNEGYASFEAFLGELASRKRKAIRKERTEALADGISIHWLTGSDLTEEVWDAFFGFYIETGSRKWGRPYLNRKFYSLIGQSMADRILLVMAKRAGRWIAGAINFIGEDTLYGRHWGAIEHHPFLHFEVCYHQAIDYAIANKLRIVEAGAQGEHKLARGYMPVMTRSAHYIVDPQFRAAIAHYLDRERRYVEEAGEELAQLGPYRRTEGGPQEP